MARARYLLPPLLASPLRAIASVARTDMKRQLEPNVQELSGASMKDVAEKLRALITVNNEIIGRIEACADQKFVKGTATASPFFDLSRDD